MKKIILVFCVWSICAISQQCMGEQIPQSSAEQEFTNLYPIVRYSFVPSPYAKILMSRLRSATSSAALFRTTTRHITEILISKVMQCLNTQTVSVTTPSGTYAGTALNTTIELVSIKRSGDALLYSFQTHLPTSDVSKIRIQRNPTTAEPSFQYMKLSPTLTSSNTVILLDPTIATGGTLDMAISILKETGVAEEKIIVASLLAGKEGIQRLCQKYPSLRLVCIELDESLDEHKNILPGLGDFGDRYYNFS